MTQKVSVHKQLSARAERVVPPAAFSELVRRTLRRFREILTPALLGGRRWYMVHDTKDSLGQDIRVEVIHDEKFGFMCCGFLASEPVEKPGGGKDRAESGEGMLAGPHVGEKAAGSRIILGNF